MKTLIKTTDLTKQYKEHKAVDHVSMTINQGDIYGFIGKNGAGKTTFIRLLTKLIKESSGSIHYASQKPLKMGAVIEGPSCYPYLSAKENLMYYAIQGQIPNAKQRVEEVLNFVGLSHTGKKTFKDFSLGMKQRLGIGLAILNKPDFLVLDEPINGLDPQGIVEIRKIIQKLNADGTTILISSHILSELSMIATRYGIIHEGKLIKELSKEALEAECQRTILLNSSDNPTSNIILSQAGYQIEASNQVLEINNTEKSHLATIAKLLYEHDIYLIEATYKEENLENYFLNLVNGGLPNV